MRTEHKEGGMSLITLGIEIERVDSGEVLALISLPCVNTIIVGIE